MTNELSTFLCFSPFEYLLGEVPVRDSLIFYEIIYLSVLICRKHELCAGNNSFACR